jgi:hypothetical protein
MTVGAMLIPPGWLAVAGWYEAADESSRRGSALWTNAAVAEESPGSWPPMRLSSSLPATWADAAKK